MAVEIVDTLDVCTDCYMASAGCLEGETETTPLALIDSGVVVPSEDGDGHFSNWGCLGCGSRLAGQRYAVTILSA